MIYPKNPITGKHLENLKAVLDFEYAQWIEADQHLDYRVVAEVLPLQATGYAVAHRTGVIGQVFRRRQPIFIPDGPKNRLYDTFDPKIIWELTIPLFNRGQLVAVLNLEGEKTPEINATLWERLVKAISRETERTATVQVPLPDDCAFVETHHLGILRSRDDSAIESSLSLAREAAKSGQHLLLAGHLPQWDHGRFPNVAQALAEKEDIGGCFCGFESGIDLLPLGKTGLPPSAQNHWRSLTEGRYSFVLEISGTEGS